MLLVFSVLFPISRIKKFAAGNHEETKDYADLDERDVPISLERLLNALVLIFLVRLRVLTFCLFDAKELID
jgi:hypothetical protein